MTNKENIRQQKYKKVSITQPMRNKKIASSFLDSLEQEHINTRTTKLLFPIVILPEEIQIIRTNTWNLRKKDFTIWFDQNMMPFYKIISIRSSKAAV